uniref:Uncharacterized protein n=1 Tax=Salarias fasciatus TaxID=181472 RepID=A0A672HNX9_SALFA
MDELFRPQNRPPPSTVTCAEPNRSSRVQPEPRVKLPNKWKRLSEQEAKAEAVFLKNRQY